MVFAKSFSPINLSQIIAEMLKVVFFKKKKRSNKLTIKLSVFKIISSIYSSNERRNEEAHNHNAETMNSHTN